MKIENNKHFIDWFNHVFPFCYGSGEHSILEGLRQLMLECGGETNSSSYDFRELEHDLGALATWLIINALCKDDIIDYGTSPRFGWLTKRGEILREFILRHTIDELEAILDVDLDVASNNYYISCSPGCCNCGPNGFEEGVDCGNPMFSKDD